MTRRIGSLLVFLGLAGSVWGQTDDVRRQAGGGASTEGEGRDTPGALAEKLPKLIRLLGFGGYVETSATLNLDRPSAAVNDFRAFDTQARGFRLDAVKLEIEKPVDDEVPVGVRVDLLYGEIAESIGSAGLGSTEDEFDLEQAYITYRAPIGRGLDITVGKFVTFIGGEVIESKDNFNYSRGLLFFWAIPFTHTGAKVEYSFCDAFSAGAHLVNGWDVTDDNNKSLSVGVSTSLAPFAGHEGALGTLNVSTNFLFGPEQSDAPLAHVNGNNRALLDIVTTFQPVESLELLVNYDYAEEENDPGALLGGGVAPPAPRDSQWYGVSVGARYWILPRKLAIAGRWEYFKDAQGARTGSRQVLREITVTLDWRPWDFLILRPEVRVDWGSARTFNDPDGTGPLRPKDAHQTTASISAVFTF